MNDVSDRQFADDLESCSKFADTFDDPFKGQKEMQECATFEGKPLRTEDAKDELKTKTNNTSKSNSIDQSKPNKLGKAEKALNVLAGATLGVGAVLVASALVSNPIGWAILGIGAAMCLTMAISGASTGTFKQSMKYMAAGAIAGAVVAGGAGIAAGGAAAAAHSLPALGAALKAGAAKMGLALKTFVTTQKTTLGLIGGATAVLGGGMIAREMLVKARDKNLNKYAENNIRHTSTSSGTIRMGAQIERSMDDQVQRNRRTIAKPAVS